MSKREQLRIAWRMRVRIRIRRLWIVSVNYQGLINGVLLQVKGFFFLVYLRTKKLRILLWKGYSYYMKWKMLLSRVLRYYHVSEFRVWGLGWFLNVGSIRNNFSIFQRGYTWYVAVGIKAIGLRPSPLQACSD